MKHFLLLGLFLWGINLIIFPLSRDYYLKQAEGYQREAKFYFNQAEGYERDARYYNNQAQKYLKDAEYYAGKMIWIKLLPINDGLRMPWIRLGHVRDGQMRLEIKVKLDWSGLGKL